MTLTDTPTKMVARDAWAFFSGFSTHHGIITFSAFFSCDGDQGFHAYIDHTDDLPLTAILIPY
jgi:hypothetical protein